MACQRRARPVMLSAAKHLGAHRGRPFAALRVTRWESGREAFAALGMAWQRRARPVMLSVAKHLGAHRGRPFAALRVTRWGQGGRPFAALRVTRWESGSQTLRYAQGDTMGSGGRPSLRSVLALNEVNGVTRRGHPMPRR